MKKRLLASLLMLTMTVGMLAGCGGSAKEEAAEETSEEGKIAIDVVAAQYGSNTADWWANFVEEFNAANEEYELSVDVVSWNDIYTEVSTRIKNGQAPDVLNIDVFADYQADDLLLPASDYISEETYAKFYDAFLDQSVVDDTVWAVPDLASARAVYYNKDILEAAGVEAPTTWDELKDVCAAIKAYDDSIYPWGIDMTTDEGQAAFAYYSWNNGGDFTDADGNWTINSEENIAAVEFEMELVESGYTNTDPANETRYDLQDMFGAGQVAMVIAPNNLPTYLSDGGYEVNYEVAPIPTNVGESASVGVMDRFMCFDNGHSDAKLEGIKKFFDFFYDDARYADWVTMEGFIPATKSGGDAMIAADESMKIWVDMVGAAKFYPVAKAEWADVKQGVIEVEQNALLGGDIKELLDELQSSVE